MLAVQLLWYDIGASWYPFGYVALMVGSIVIGELVQRWMSKPLVIEVVVEATPQEVVVASETNITDEVSVEV